MTEILQPEGWETPKRILVVLAHPDDPEFFFGATIARWTDAGHSVTYLLLTRGDKGGENLEISSEELAATREVEQRNAARVLGVQEVRFLHNPDGFLHPNDDTRRDVVREIRRKKPDILVSCDPTNYFIRNSYINHPDHRAAGQIALDAVFPAAGNVYYYPELIREEGLQPHTPAEVWLSTWNNPDVILDVTDHWNQKIKALHAHISQMGDPRQFDEHLLDRRTADSSADHPRFEETFRRLVQR